MVLFRRWLAVDSLSMAKEIRMLKRDRATSRALPQVFAKSMLAARPGLMAALKGAVASGDAPSAHNFFRAVAGPAAAEKLAGKDQLAELKGWLSRQP